MKSQNFSAISKIREYILEAEQRLVALKGATEMPVEQRMRNEKVVKEKLAVYKEIDNYFNFFVLHQDVLLETLHNVVDAAMANNGVIGISMTRQLSKLHHTLEDQYEEYQKEE